MTGKEALQRLSSFERDHGAESLSLACHAALPVVLNPEVLHLLRINYFLDPPHVLPYTAEASLLLSSMCTEIDDGLYMIHASIRDVLLERLVADYGGARVRDVARLLWEYSQRGTPWAQRPGLTEAQQLTALNFIEPQRALEWLARARRGEGAVPVDDVRWFVVLEQDLIDRGAAVRKAEGDGVFPAAQLPALTELRDALMKLSGGRRTAQSLASRLELELPPSALTGASRSWDALLDAVWTSNRMPEFFEAVTADIGRSERWRRAMEEYWFKLAPALRVEGIRFEAPPPEWQLLEEHRENLQNAIRALAIVYARPLGGEPRMMAIGALVGDYRIITHWSVTDDPLQGRKIKPGYSVWAEFAEDRFSLDTEATPGSPRRLELTGAIVDKKTKLGVLLSDPNADRTQLPRPLYVLTDAPPRLARRKVCVMGYPGADTRNRPDVRARIFGNTYNILRLQPGQVVGEDLTKGLLFHNCVTAGGNGGSPLIDIITGHVLGVHFAGFNESGPHGLKKAQAIETFRLARNSSLVKAGVFWNPSEVRDRHAVREATRFSSEHVFVNRAAEQQIFHDLLAKKSGRGLFVEGRAGIGKTALLLRFAELARQRGIRDVFVDARAYFTSPPRLGLMAAIGNLLPVSAAVDIHDETAWLHAFRQALADTPTVLFIDDPDDSTESLIAKMMDVVQNVSTTLALLVVASRSVMPNIQNYYFGALRMIRLAPFSRADVQLWLAEENLPQEAAPAIMSMSKGVPLQIAMIMDSLRRDGLIEPPPSLRSPAVPAPSTVDVKRPKDATIVFHDDASETHGPFVVTRGTHVITVPQWYRIGTFPVTNELFAAFVRAGGYHRDELWAVSDAVRAGFTCRNGEPGPGTWPSPTPEAHTAGHPVAGISYYEALAFASWLDREVSAPPGMRWCLPSENMWEFAARGRKGLLYPWGSSFEAGRCNSREANLNATSVVGQFSGASPFGALDMAGNVWEFVRTGDHDTCVLRGGSFKNAADEVKSSLRLIGVPRQHRPPDFGMRCALEPKTVTPPPKKARSSRSKR